MRRSFQTTDGSVRIGLLNFTDEDIKLFLVEKKSSFERGIVNLSKKWQNLVEQNIYYVIKIM